jgi:hypothetical protein
MIREDGQIPNFRGVPCSPQYELQSCRREIGGRRETGRVSSSPYDSQLLIAVCRKGPARTRARERRALELNRGVRVPSSGCPAAPARVSGSNAAAAAAAAPSSCSSTVYTPAALRVEMDALDVLT